MTQSSTQDHWIPNFNIMGTTGSITFKIPITSKKKWWQFWKKNDNGLSDIIRQYKEEIIFDEKSGEVFINGKSSIPYQKDYWF